MNLKMALVFIPMVLFCFGCISSTNPQGELSINQGTSGFFVSISGSIEHPGRYELPKGSSVSTIVSMLGDLGVSNGLPYKIDISRKQVEGPRWVFIVEDVDSFRELSPFPLMPEDEIVIRVTDIL